MAVNHRSHSSGASPYCPPPEVGSRLPGASGWKRTPRPFSDTAAIFGASGAVMLPPLLPATP